MVLLLLLASAQLQLLAQDANGNRKRILSDIRVYRDSTVMAHTYTVSADTLLADVKDILTSSAYPFKVVSEARNETVLKVYFSISSPSAGATRRRGGASRHSTRWKHLVLTAKVEKAESRSKLLFTEKTRTAKSGSRARQFPNSPRYEDVWSEFTLRWELYRRYNNRQSPPLPKELMARITKFNEGQRSEKRKLKVGKDY